MTTAQEVFNLCMDLIDERLDSGVISESDTRSYAVKTPGILTLLQSELIKQGDIFKTHEISNYPVANLLGYISNFDIRPYEGKELIFEAKEPAKAYYFEVDNDATVYIEDFNGTWNTLATINAVPTASGFTAYKGVVTPSNGATKSRIRFAGNNYYRTLNRALFGVSFAEVPDYRPWVKKTMPDDFKSVNEIVEEYPDRQYRQDANYKWEGRRNLYINYYFVGRVRIVYRPVPAVITTLTDIMQVDDVTARTIMPNGLAAHLMLTENPAAASFFNQRYEELKFQASKRPPGASEMIGNVYGEFNA